MTLFTRHGDIYRATFGEAEAGVLHQVFGEVATLLSDGSERADPVLERFFPDVYTDDPEQSAEFRRYTESDLRAAKLDQVGAILAELPVDGGDVTLSEEQSEAWLRALTDARIALGLRLDIRDDTDLEAEIDEAVGREPTAPRVGQLLVYALTDE